MGFLRNRLAAIVHSAAALTLAITTQNVQAQTASPPASTPSATPAPTAGSPPPPVVVAPPPAPALPDTRPKLDLSQANLYVYDFLDVREKVYQPKVLDEIELQLNQWLATKAKAVTFIRSQQTPFVKNRDADSWQADISTEHEVDRVPVGQSIASNASAEAAVGSDHQLIVFPASFTVSGVWRFYTIRFVLVRKSDRKMWQYFYEGSHMVMLKEGERSKSRAQKIVEQLAVAMAKDGIIDPASGKVPS